MFVVVVVDVRYILYGTMIGFLCCLSGIVCTFEAKGEVCFSQLVNLLFSFGNGSHVSFIYN